MKNKMFSNEAQEVIDKKYGSNVFTAYAATCDCGISENLFQLVPENDDDDAILICSDCIREVKDYI